MRPVASFMLDLVDSLKSLSFWLYSTRKLA